jgi:DNA-binding XRE family transcriptional regulator
VGNAVEKCLNKPVTGLLFSSNQRLKNLGLFIRAKRVQLGISQEELARQLQVHTNTVSFLERGLRTPSFLLVIDICNVLQINLMDVAKSVDQSEQGGSDSDD